MGGTIQNVLFKQIKHFELSAAMQTVFNGSRVKISTAENLYEKGLEQKRRPVTN